MEESVFMDGVRSVFTVIDRGVYSLITVFYNIITELANATIISSDKINEISQKVYALIAIFMIFKISFSLINYLVNPDLLQDKTKGGGKLIQNILITFVLVICVPFGFDFLYNAQKAILSDALIEKLIYNSESLDTGEMSFLMDPNCTEKATTSSIGDYVGLMAFKTFFQIDEMSLENHSEDFNGIKDKYCRADVSEGTGTASVKNLLKNSEVYNAPHGISVKHYYVVSYTFFISTVVGIVLALVFLSFCFDVAVRTIKLQFLELLAPIPIISYIDPDKSKNGMFSKWIKEVATTWLSLFMRLLAFHVAIYFISLLSDIDWDQNGLWINLLLIIGILMFAKQLPKLLENIMGIKASGNFNLNPFKKLETDMLGAKQISGAASGALGFGLGATASIYARNKGKQKFASKYDKALDADTSKKLNDKYMKKINDAIASGMSEDRVDQMFSEFDREEQRLLKKQMNRDFRAEKASLTNKFGAVEAGVSGIRGASRGYKAGSKGGLDPASIARSATQGATEASKIRSYNDNYSLGDRIMDKVTDIADVKNDSGTASLVGKEIKELTKQLETVTQALDMKRMQISRLDPMAVGNDVNTGQPYVRDNYNGPDRLTAEALVNETKELTNTMENLKSEIKKRQDMKDQKRPGPPPKPGK